MRQGEEAQAASRWPRRTSEGKGWWKEAQEGRNRPTSGAEAQVHTATHCPLCCLAQNKHSLVITQVGSEKDSPLDQATGE